MGPLDECGAAFILFKVIADFRTYTNELSLYVQQQKKIVLRNSLSITMKSTILILQNGSFVTNFSYSLFFFLLNKETLNTNYFNGKVFT